jgi:ribosomal protein S12 methylthiotransferase
MAAQVPDRVKQQRLEELMLTQQKIAFAKNKRRIGSELTCLVDTIDDNGNGRGRFYGQAPDIDSVCIIKNRLENTGKFIKTRVIGTKKYDLVVKQV